MNRSMMIRIAAALMILVVAACEKHQPEDPAPEKPAPEQPAPDNPSPEEPSPEILPLEVNSFDIDGVRRTFSSVTVSNLGEYICIAATPAEGVEEFDAVFEQDEYFYVAISPLLNGEEFDLMSEERLYTVISTIKGAELESVAPSMREEITSGTCSFNCAEGMVDVHANLILTGGAALEVRLSAEEPGIVVNENIFAIDGNEKPVRTAFRKVEEGITALYITPAGISFFDELEIATYYAYIILDESSCHGRTLSVSDLRAVGYVDNINGIVVDSGEVLTSGTVNVAADPDDPAHYIVAADLDFAGIPLKIRFDGNTIDAAQKPVVESELIYAGKAYAISEVWLNTRAAEITPVPLTTVMMCLEDGRSLDITLPGDFLDGNAHGFSQSPYLYMEFDGKTYSKVEGYSGTVTVAVNKGIINVDATNYDDLKVTYEGPFKQIQ